MTNLFGPWVMWGKLRCSRIASAVAAIPVFEEVFEFLLRQHRVFLAP